MRDDGSEWLLNSSTTYAQSCLDEDNTNNLIPMQNVFY